MDNKLMTKTPSYFFQIFQPHYDYYHNLNIKHQIIHYKTMTITIVQDPIYANAWRK